MNVVSFRKYHGAGNDFVVIDNRHDGDTASISSDQRNSMCHRNFGIGADGVLEILSSSIANFKLIYYNADGYVGSLCGNGSRCAVSYVLKSLDGHQSQELTFECNGVIYHGGYISQDDKYYLYMNDVKVRDIYRLDDSNYFLDNGSPHHVQFVTNIQTVKVGEVGPELCYGRYSPHGSNINFCTRTTDKLIKARTFERGVDKETLACGTGATAVAIIAHFHDRSTVVDEIVPVSYDVEMPGGTLTVEFKESKEIISDIKLIGPAVEVFQGNYTLI
ncbi:diaminopimelate epimerase [Patella vulgata]|uniref:diaminopimelate epimerase n=1 Tax=Patella vulgata TaxID=6465 RepID=UPI00217F7F5F|nr:diaminopimelate epimerase [Patella vulgata]